MEVEAIKAEVMKEMQHQLGIAIEAFQSKLDLVIEGMMAMEERLTRKIESFRDELKAEIEVTQCVVRELAIETRKNSAAIERHSKELEKHGRELKEHGRDIREIRKALAS